MSSRVVAFEPRDGKGLGTQRLRVIVLPNTAWKATAHQPGEAPDSDRLRKLLAERGIDLVVIDPLPPPFNPLSRGHPFFAGLDPVRALILLLRYRSTDLVISVFESGAVVLLLLRRLFFFKVPVALWDVSVGSTWRPRRIALGLVVPWVDRLFSLSRWQKSAIERQYRLRAPTEVIGYAVDEVFYHPNYNRSAEHVLSVGEDNARDYRTLLAAVRDLPTSVVLKTRYSGEVPENAAATIRVIRERLSFVQLRDLYASASMVVIPLVPSDHPSGITTLFEAMAMGKAIIATDVSMIREFITDGETGITVPVGDPVALQNAISVLLGEPNERARLGRNARSYFEAQLTQNAFAGRLAESIRRAARS